jgi:hypothetical protein
MQVYHVPYWEMEANMTDADFVQLMAVIGEQPKKKKHGLKLSDFAR